MFFTEQHYNNPYRTYSTERKNGPISWINELNAWFVSSYDISLELFDSPYLSSFRRKSINFSEEEQLNLNELIVFYGDWLMYNDPPNHEILRSIGSKTFKKHFELINIEEIQVFLNNIFENKFKTNNIFDVVQKISNPISKITFEQTFNIPKIVSENFFKRSESIVQFLGNPNPNYETALKTQEDLKYIATLLPEIETEAKSIERESNGLINVTTARNVIFNILIDGYKSLASSITNAFYVMIENKLYFQNALREKFEIEQVVEELIRMEPVFQFASRKVIKEFTIDNEKLKIGDKVMLSIGSGNRDEKYFSTGIELANLKQKHLSFGYAKHYCIGAPLARKILLTIVAVSLDKVKNLNIVSKEWEPSIGYRSLQSLEVQVLN